MATIFPSSPTVGQRYQSYEWNGTAWVTVGIDLTEDYATQVELDTHSTASTSVHGISDTSELETTTGAQIKADAAESAANSYTDSSINAVQAIAVSAKTLALLGL